ncbi:ankyrin repeats (3 copies) domain-containing protein [Cordyceps javanica]|uniref:Ankyrin repeats (3 copies) domain-containing protein n=1 Tax=Cordyceps javanica TaxID=43265 RepID=A0A545V6K6_9HYPO|nr:ankyrin repeats (3 copies) domain-containing protein [Cordyceps javanica]TQW08578.1 ankyrin repeats (3 copies) domain-containing protein [Cordyceps javanica]
MRHLPNELVVSIASRLESARDLSALARTDQRLSLCADPVLYGCHGSSALAWGARHGRDATVRKALRFRAPSVGESLDVASALGHESVVRLLLAAYAGDRADDDDAVNHGHRALVQAIRHNQKATATLLLESPAKVAFDARDASGRTLLSHVASGEEGGGWPAATLARRLLATGKVDPDARDHAGRTPLSHAAAAHDVAVVGALLDTGRVDLDARDGDGRTPLSYAASAVGEGSEAVVARLLLLLERDAVSSPPDVNAKDRLGWTPLMHAVVHGAEDKVELLLATGTADIQSRDNYGRTPLSQARSRGYMSIARLLLDWHLDKGSIQKL